MKSGISGLAAIGLAIHGVPASAHHSYSMFDGDTTLTLEGTVVDFQWTNPHAWVLMMVPNEDGEPVRWALELPSPGGLARRGWKPRTLTPGMTVTAAIHPLKDGRPGGSGLTFTLPDGAVMVSLTSVTDQGTLEAPP